ncbi:sensor histidine kinase [Clostridium lundense]|uniref:sensor histidine kinase n=1 Tax=Clostridium lundense TaxID=319475 RepID=UPI00054D3B71|nr:sensor histidine kinase [Clostridium lundense]
MKIIDYIKDHAVCTFVNIISMITLSLFLLAVGNKIDIVFIIIISWIIIFTSYLFIRYYLHNRYLTQLLNTMEQLDKKYLISEVMQRPTLTESKIYYQILKSSNKSMIEQIAAVKRERKEYKEYIEQWIHEIKTPIAAMKLVCDNHKSEITRTLLIELEKTNHFAEQALYFARSENLEKDYLINETILSKILHYTITENKQLLIKNQVTVQVVDCDYTVYTDAKWISFILNQLIVNAVKYRKQNPILCFSANIVCGGVSLSVTDNGIGIVESDLPRIFEKGFSGENGRKEKHSTGIGLYLCKRLSDKLGIKITAESQIDKGTTVTLFFPKGNFVKVQD